MDGSTNADRGWAICAGRIRRVSPGDRPLDQGDGGGGIGDLDDQPDVVLVGEFVPVDGGVAVPQRREETPQRRVTCPVKSNGIATPPTAIRSVSGVAGTIRNTVQSSRHSSTSWIVPRPAPMQEIGAQPNGT
jgi:hypothetical protein